MRARYLLAPAASSAALSEVMRSKFCNCIAHVVSHTRISRRIVLQCVAVCCSAFALQILQLHCLRRVTQMNELLQCAAVCCSVLQCVAVCCSVLQCVALCCTVLQCVALCVSVLRCVNAVPLRCKLCHCRACVTTYAHESLQCVAVCCSVLQCDAVRCSVLQCVAVHCSVLQCVAVCCSV